ncbi:hypothetical protein WH47_05928 [Habropoda laboriosa]|uniref:Histone-lysine N-methyltransferase SETMAR n=1 Tax=Habropoda laboriosa TaxID=597456 RepID=A0A0L7REL1_9HYME|nr:hypothetical protein WH47_05928 [Habropoda laboriosa]
MLSLNKARPHLAEVIKEYHLADRHFNSVNEIQKSMDDFVTPTLQSFYRNEISMLPER